MKLLSKIISFRSLVLSLVREKHRSADPAWRTYSLLPALEESAKNVRRGKTETTWRLEIPQNPMSALEGSQISTPTHPKVLGPGTRRRESESPEELHGAWRHLRAMAVPEGPVIVRNTCTNWKIRDCAPS